MYLEKYNKKSKKLGKIKVKEETKNKYIKNADVS
jgi:hypothetical protein